ncbi:MAG TPA: hypothetical protein PLU52_05575 [Opitutaceae bacterium]|nr:hypothetical protein [Opitutaceae bacterium]HND60695.1 hypothetical protein [Opitutaceae bacterium]
MTFPRPRLACLLVLMFPSLLVASAAEPAAGRRLLFDDYHQRARPEGQFAQGVARGGPELRNLSNFYSPDATAIPNGTFVFAASIADLFQVEVSRAPLTAELLRGAGAYMLVCPVRADRGGRANLGEADAALLEEFVARGGSLLLVANNIPDPAKSDLDLAGLNLIAGRFGLRFLATQTDTLSIPIPADLPGFDGARALIFGNGTNVEVLPGATARVLLESHGHTPGPVAVLATHGRGRVLVFGDAGTFGNAHLFRDDIGQETALRRLMALLLPDGPVPRYGWKEHSRLRVRVRQEQIISGYPELLRVFGLPHPAGTAVYTSDLRPIDLAAGGDQAAAPGARDFVSAVSAREAEFTLALGADDGRAHAATWTSGSGNSTARLLPTGRQLEPGAPAGEALVDWQGVLLNDLIGAPLMAYARPGDAWTATVLEALPQLRLTPTPRRIEAPAHLTFVGEAELDGTPCYVFRRTVRLDGTGWEPGDLVGPEYAPQFDPRRVHLMAAGQLAVTTYWIDRTTLLPRRTELHTTAEIWWRDARLPSRYIGTHDSKNHETWTTANLNLTYGRVLTADFAPAQP